MCPCKVGYTDIAGVCQGCHYTCKTCSGFTLNDCLTCDTANNWKKVGSTCVCNPGYYDPTPEKILVNKGNPPDFSATKGLGQECEGECDNDAECA